MSERSRIVSPRPRNTRHVSLRRPSSILRTVATVLLLGGASLALAGCDSTAAPEPTVTPEPTEEPFTLVVGDCIAAEDEAEESDSDAPEPTATPEPLGSLPVIDCAEPHSLEVYASFDLPSGPFPGDSLIIDAATDGCLDEFEAFIGLPAHESKYQVRSLYPTQNSWLNGDREVLCLVTDPKGTTTGSLFGAQK